MRFTSYAGAARRICEHSRHQPGKLNSSEGGLLYLLRSQHLALQVALLIFDVLNLRTGETRQGYTHASC